MRTRTLLVAAAATALVAACSPGVDSTPAPVTQSAVQPAAHGVEAAIADIPWDQVGPGWVLATWSPVSGGHAGSEPVPGEPAPGTAPSTVYLVDPAGGRYPITTFPPAGDHAVPELIAWSGDGGHAVFDPRDSKHPGVIVVDVRTGAQNRIPVDGDVLGFATPRGNSLLVVNVSDPERNVAMLERVDLAGNRELTYPADNVPGLFTGYALPAPDGQRLVLGTLRGLTVLDEGDGSHVTDLATPANASCAPLRWWDGQAGVVLARCDVRPMSLAHQLWLIPVDGGTPTALTAPNDGSTGPDLGDANAWKLASGTFVQALGACGVIYLAKLNADGTTTEVDVPGTDGSTRVLGAHDDTLLVQAKAACGGGQAVLSYDPAANTSTVLLGAGLNGGGVVTALAYPEPAT
jgi:hypothetical protein